MGGDRRNGLGNKLINYKSIGNGLSLAPYSLLSFYIPIHIIKSLLQWSTFIFGKRFVLRPSSFIVHPTTTPTLLTIKGDGRQESGRNHNNLICPNTVTYDYPSHIFNSFQLLLLLLRIPALSCGSG